LVAKCRNCSRVLREILLADGEESLTGVMDCDHCKTGVALILTATIQAPDRPIFTCSECGHQNADGIYCEHFAEVLKS
jgi:hypothetical protein